MLGISLLWIVVFSQHLGFKKGEIPYTGLSAFPADETMRKKAVEAVHEVAPDVQVFEGRVCTGDQFISSKEQKEAITSNFVGMCCEMEGGAIAQACYLNETPFVIIRAISDKADDSEEMNYELLKKEAAENCASVVRYIITAVDTSIRMKNEDGFCVDINSFEGIPRDETLIRINVDDFDEAYQFLKERGFRNFMGEGKLLETSFFKGAHMESPSGFGIMLMQHIKD